MRLYKDYMDNMTVLAGLKPSRTGRVSMFIILVLIFATVMVLWFTPWIQTAKGFGVVSTLQPENRIQAISALVPGQIETWHVQEGQRVKAGESIVTLKDQDSELLNRLSAELRAKRQQYDAAGIALQAAELDLDRQQALLEDGLVSPRKRDSAQIAVQEAKTKRASIAADITQVETKLARQSTQTKKAPKDGIITRLMGAGLATTVSAGDVLAQFVPDRVERAVSIQVTGLDAPLIHPGRKVRLQFDGWPVFQFSGWPSIAIGTFGGIVQFVEPVANESGLFTVWIVQDPDDRDWPNADFVRLGSKARAWVLLEQVRLGYEIWRQLNNFPPNPTVDIKQ